MCEQNGPHHRDPGVRDVHGVLFARSRSRLETAGTLRGQPTQGRQNDGQLNAAGVVGCLWTRRLALRGGRCSFLTAGTPGPDGSARVVAPAIGQCGRAPAPGGCGALAVTGAASATAARSERPARQRCGPGHSRGHRRGAAGAGAAAPRAAGRSWIPRHRQCPPGCCGRERRQPGQPGKPRQAAREAARQTALRRQRRPAVAILAGNGLSDIYCVAKSALP